MVRIEYLDGEFGEVRDSLYDVKVPELRNPDGERMYKLQLRPHGVGVREPLRLCIYGTSRTAAVKELIRLTKHAVELSRGTGVTWVATVSELEPDVWDDDDGGFGLTLAELRVRDERALGDGADYLLMWAGWDKDVVVRLRAPSREAALEEFERRCEHARALDLPAFRLYSTDDMGCRDELLAELET